LIWWLIAEGVTRSVSAASRKLPWRAAARNARKAGHGKDDLGPMVELYSTITPHSQAFFVGLWR